MSCIQTNGSQVITADANAHSVGRTAAVGQPINVLVNAVRVRYQTVEIGEIDIHLRTLRDLNEYADDQCAAELAGIPPASWPLFGVVWASSRVLAHRMLSFNVEGRRILEVGCGIGRTSLLLQSLNADISATDWHPEVASFLDFNARLNDLNPIPYRQCDWEQLEDRLGKFDLILGSDLVYEPGHPELLSSFIDRHARSQCEVLTVGPGRREQTRFNRCMVELGYRYWHETPEDLGYLAQPFRGRIHRFQKP